MKKWKKVLCGTRDMKGIWVTYLSGDWGSGIHIRGRSKGLASCSTQIFNTPLWRKKGTACSPFHLYKGLVRLQNLDKREFSIQLKINFNAFWLERKYNLEGSRETKSFSHNHITQRDLYQGSRLLSSIFNEYAWLNNWNHTAYKILHAIFNWTLHYLRIILLPTKSSS